MSNFREVRQIAGAAGVAITAGTPQRFIVPRIRGKGEFEVIPESASVVVTEILQFQLNPRLAVLKTEDRGGTFTDYSAEAQDGDAGTDVVLSSLPAAPIGFLFVGAHTPFRGVQVDVDAANGTASVLTAEYSKVGSWAGLTETDGTAAAGATFGQDGAITWTMPTDWVPLPLIEMLRVLYPTLNFALRNYPVAQREALGLPLYWAKIGVSVALDASATQNSMLSLNRVAADKGSYPAGTGVRDSLSTDLIDGVGNIELDAAAGTITAVVNVYAESFREAYV